MVKDILPAGSSLQRRDIVQVPGDDVHPQRPERFGFCGRAGQGGYVVPPAPQGFRKVPADKAGGTGYQRFHMGRS
jgi:hypothetical protein